MLHIWFPSTFPNYSATFTLPVPVLATQGSYYSQIIISCFLPSGILFSLSFLHLLDYCSSFNIQLEWLFTSAIIQHTFHKCILLFISEKTTVFNYGRVVFFIYEYMNTVDFDCICSGQSKNSLLSLTDLILRFNSIDAY